jgi:hypothetical protein
MLPFVAVYEEALMKWVVVFALIVGLIVRKSLQERRDRELGKFLVSYPFLKNTRVAQMYRHWPVYQRLEPNP